MPVRQRSGELAVGLFRPGRIQVAGAQTRLYVANRNALIKRGKRRGKRGRCIAVNQHGVGLPLGQHRLEAKQHATRNVIQVLPRFHEVQVKVGLDVKQAEHLVEHVPVLRRHADFDIEG